MKTAEIRMNSLEVYSLAGTKAGKAAKHRDWSLVNHHTGWLRKAIRMEPTEYAALAQTVFNEAYRQEARP